MKNEQAKVEAKKLRNRLYKKGTFIATAEYSYAEEDNDSFVALRGFTDKRSYIEVFHEAHEAQAFKA